MHTATDKNSSNTFGLVMVAAMAGAVAGLLLAPKRGTEMREDIKGKYNGMKTKAQNSAEDVQSTVTGGVEAATSKMKDVADKAKHSVDKASDKINDAKSSETPGIISDDIDTALGRRPRL